MKKVNLRWSVEDLLKNINKIEFPEYQREPTVWDLDKKRKLVDSILRQYDIANIYLYKRDDGNYECIDGRQRINAIISFLGLNETTQIEQKEMRFDNFFKFRSSDELLGTDELKDFDNKNWKEFTDSQRKKILQYQFNVLEISDIENSQELNLMFLRLQLGAALNAGEKLNAMVGDMRDFIFSTTAESRPLGEHKYFSDLAIPKSRFSNQLTAAQIAINFFSLEKKKGFRRARFLDLQEFFGANVKFTSEENAIADLLTKRLDEAHLALDAIEDLKLKNRAIGVTTFFFINNLIISGRNEDIPEFVSFLKKFLSRLKKFLDTLRVQLKSGAPIVKTDENFLKFQTYITQAAVEKTAIESRQKLLEMYFNYYKNNKKKILGDS